jgi:acetyltransferase-like isoleucine patch superfamily enzyme
MPDYRTLFKSCGQNVFVDETAYIEHPELLEVGDNVHFARGFHMIEGPKVCRIRSNVSFFPNCFLQGLGERLIVADHVEFYPNSYISFGGGSLEIGHHTHFAPGCCLYGHGGLKIGPYCNIAANCVLATVGHDPVIRDQPMALAPACKGPITLVEDVWLGANVTVTADVTIAKGCVIGANAVVTKNTEPFGLYVGVPARRLRDRKKSEPPKGHR